MMYFIAGLVVSLVVTYNIHMIAEKNPPMTALSSFISALLGAVVVAKVVIQDSTLIAIFYALGIALGSFIVVYFAKE